MAESYDVLIAGAGITACTFARILVKAGMRVVMIDIGSQFGSKMGINLNNDPIYQRNPYQLAPIVKGLTHAVSVPPKFKGSSKNALNPLQDPNKNLPGAGVAYALGGMAIHWTCAIPRFHKSLEEIQCISSNEWDDDLYPEAEQYLNRNTNVHTNSLRHKAIKKVLDDTKNPDGTKKWEVKDTPLAAQRITNDYVHYTGADTVLDTLSDKEWNNLSILPNHCVRSLIYKGGKISSALVRSLIPPEDEREIFADYFIVASGYLHTPQILWNSFIRPKALGCYLSDHTFTACRILLKDDILEQIRSEALNASLLDKSDPFPIPMTDQKPHLYIPISDTKNWHGQLFQESFQDDFLPENIDDRLVVDLKWFGMIDPVEHNKVTFTNDIRDKHKMPQATFHFELGADDKKRLYEMMIDMQLVAHELGDYLPGFGPVHVDLGKSTHTMGTTRMGAQDDGTCVTDSYSKVWGFDNLYLGGNCLIPTHTASNPTLTTVALAIKAARSLLSGRNKSTTNQPQTNVQPTNQI